VDLVFVGGVHGVGKSTVCTEVCEALGLRVIAASALIKGERNVEVADRGKLVADVTDNQQLLVRGFKRIERDSGAIQVLDGHFVLRTTAGKIERIASHVFEQLGVRRIVCFMDKPAAILQRLRERDGGDGDIHEVTALQDEELNHADSVANHLRIPSHRLAAFDAASLRAMLTRVW
jgi:adenylate kinase